MGSSALPLMLLLMSFIHAGLTQDSPRSTLTVTPDNTVFTGETVNLTCVIESNHSDWRYEWFKDSTNNPMSQTSDRYTVNRDTLTIREVTTSDQDQYCCRGRRDEGTISSYSRSVSLTVEERPKAVVKVSPDERVFRGETVTLTCDIQRAGDIQWTYRWFKDGNTHNPYTTTTTTTAEFSFSADESYSAVYSCRGERSDSQRSDTSAAVTLTVSDKPKPALTVKPQSSVFTGDRVTLSCDVGQLTGWTILWRKDSNPESTGDETKTIESVSVSDEGEYWCRAQRGNYYSEFSNTVKITVKASSSLLVTAVVVGSSVCLLIFISLLLLWRYKKNKDQQRNINQTSVPNQSAESQPENSPLQSDSDQICDVVTEVNKRDKDGPLADVTYSEVTFKKNKKKMDKDDSMAEPNNVTYSEVRKKGKKPKSKDINTAGPTDLVYAQIDFQDKTKTKGKGAGLRDFLIEMKSKDKQRGKSSESGDTLYSELKHNTDRGADAGDATYAQPMRKKNKTRP